MVWYSQPIFLLRNKNNYLPDTHSYLDLWIIAQEKQILREFFLFYYEIVCYVYSLELPHLGNSNEYTQHTIIV